MPSIMINVEIEVEVFYTIVDNAFEATNAICQTNVSREVSQWAETQAMDQFDKRPVHSILYGP